MRISRLFLLALVACFSAFLAGCTTTPSLAISWYMREGNYSPATPNKPARGPYTSLYLALLNRGAIRLDIEELHLNPEEPRSEQDKSSRGIKIPLENNVIELKPGQMWVKELDTSPPLEPNQQPDWPPTCYLPVSAELKLKSPLRFWNTNWIRDLSQERVLLKVEAVMPSNLPTGWENCPAPLTPKPMP